MADKIYYVFCSDDCRYEGMTREQIIAAIAEATGNVPTDIDSAFITKLKELNHNEALSFWLGTEAEFNALDIEASVYKLRVDSNGEVYLTPCPTDKSQAVTLFVDDWSGNEQTVHVDGATDTNTVIVSPDPEDSNFNAYTAAGIRCVEQHIGSLTFRCNSAPADDVVANVAILS